MNPLWQQLAAAELVTGDPPPAESPGPAWYVTVLLGFAAWIAAIFLSIVIVLASDAQPSIAIVGALACAAGLLLLRINHPFVIQLGLAASIAGQAGMLFGLSSWLSGFQPAATAMAFVLIVPSLLTTNAIYRVWCTAASLLLLATALDQWAPLTVALAATIVCAAFLAFPQIPRAYGYGAAFALLLIDALSIFGHHQDPLPGYLSGLLAGLALVYAAHRLFGNLLYPALIAIVLIPAQGVAAALVLILIGFGRAAPVLTGLGIAAGIAYLSNYYYVLSLTLLHKSLVLIGSGLLLLTLRWTLLRKDPA